MEEDSGRMMAELRALQERAQQASDQLSALQAFATESTLAAATLEGLSKQGGGEAMFPLGSGAFVKAVLAKENKVLLDIGAGVVAEKSFEEASQLLRSRVEDAGKAASRIQSQLQAMLSRSDELAAKLERMQGK